METPNLGADFDVSILPWLDNFSEVEHYWEFVRVARKGNEFLARIDDVVKGARAKGDRQALLGKATWDDRTQELLAVLDGIAAKKRGGVG